MRKKRKTRIDEKETAIMKARDNGNIALIQPKCSHTRIHRYIGLSYAAMAKIGQLIGVQANESEKKKQHQNRNTKKMQAN